MIHFFGLASRCALSSARGHHSVPRSAHANIRPLGFSQGSNHNFYLQKRNFFTVINQFEKGVTFTFGKMTSVKEPGLRVRIPLIQQVATVDMRTSVSDLRRQEVITLDNVTIKVDGVVQYKIVDPQKAVCNVQGVERAIKELAQLKIREELSHCDVNDILHKREQLNRSLLEGSQVSTIDWGVELQSIRIKDIVFDESMTRAMAKRAEAERTAEAKMIDAEADVKTAKKYEEASKFYSNDPTALRLRELEAISRMSREPSNLIVLVPTQILDTIKGVK
jgi:regulator of protease activity HflC (stomatin/prohibitin superfamily)